MDKKTMKRLEAAGWKIGDASEFLGLTPEETALVELSKIVAKADVIATSA